MNEVSILVIFALSFSLGMLVGAVLMATYMIRRRKKEVSRKVVDLTSIDDKLSTLMGQVDGLEAVGTRGSSQVLFYPDNGGGE